jgi:hypothetical protein
MTRRSTMTARSPVTTSDVTEASMMTKKSTKTVRTPVLSTSSRTTLPRTATIDPFSIGARQKSTLEPVAGPSEPGRRSRHDTPPHKGSRTIRTNAPSRNPPSTRQGEPSKASRSKSAIGTQASREIVGDMIDNPFGRSSKMGRSPPPSAPPSKPAEPTSD